MTKLNDLLGQRFGKLTVIARAENNKHNSAMWLCKCDCGTEKIIQGDCLLKGHTKSCGCLRASLLPILGLKHGLGKTRLHSIWLDMRRRCYKKNRKAYKDYGGRGITICDEWKDDFLSFYNWSINNGYEDNLTIDRIDVNSNYEPSNCRWITKREQCKNTRANINITYNNQTKTLSEWAEILKINYNTLHSRIKVLKYPVEKAFTKPVQECGR